MMRNLSVFTLLAGLAFSATVEPAGVPPAEAGPALTGMMQKEGTRVKDGSKTVMEIWFRTSISAGEKSAEDNVTMTGVPQGSLMGIARFPERGSDRRGQAIKPGLYTMRLSFFPQNGDHQGVAPQRDFLVLSPLPDDKDPAATPAYESLMQMSLKGSGTPHPLVLSMWKGDAANFKPGLSLEGESDQVLQTKLGDTPISVIVMGTVSH